MDRVINRLDRRPAFRPVPPPAAVIPGESPPGRHAEVVQDTPALARLTHGAAEHFPFAFEPYQLLLGLPFGITPFTSGVTVDSTELQIRYGPWSLHTPLDNVAGAEMTGPYTLVKTAGPPHLSLVDRGISFVTRRSSGVCIRFREPVPCILPMHSELITHPGATVTVSWPHELMRLLTERRVGRVRGVALDRAARRARRSARATG
ncbi:MAG: hypothetical protein ACLFXM_11325 [Acidimicrobiia bacterium]